MDEEKKYPVQGTVSTDEYRDLITENAKLNAQVDEYRSKYWAEQTASSEAKKRAAAIEEENKGYARFIASDPELTSRFFRFRNEITSTEE